MWIACTNVFFDAVFLMKFQGLVLYETQCRYTAATLSSLHGIAIGRHWGHVLTVPWEPIHLLKIVPKMHKDTSFLQKKNPEIFPYTLPFCKCLPTSRFCLRPHGCLNYIKYNNNTINNINNNNNNNNITINNNNIINNTLPKL